MEYEVTFVYKDGIKTDTYCYPTKEEAIKHLDTFINDDSGLYKKIFVLDPSTNTILGYLRFKPNGEVLNCIHQGDLVKIRPEFGRPEELDDIYQVGNISDVTDSCVINCLTTNLFLGSSERVGVEMIYVIDK